jgi:two-component system response regulator MprA
MKIMVVDDDEKIIAFLKRALQFEGYKVEAAESGEEGLKIAKTWQPDLVILDILMPLMDGWEMCRRLRMDSDVPVLMLTAKDDVADRVRGLDLGADDYLVKPFALEELLARIRSLLRRQKVEDIAGSITGEQAWQQMTFDDLVLDPVTREVWRKQRLISLTVKEYELLVLFMERPRHVLPRELIMKRIWGADFKGESNVLEVYIGMLRQKLEDSGETRLIHTVRGIGYVLKLNGRK